MMDTRSIFSAMKQSCATMQNLSDEHNVFTEFEIRFGTVTKSRFSPQLTTDEWQSLKNRIGLGDQSVISWDQIYWPTKLYKIIERRQAVVTNFNNFTKADQIKKHLLNKQATFHKKYKVDYVTTELLRFSHMKESDFDSEAEYRAESKNIEKNPFERFKKRYSKQLTEFCRIDMTEVINAYKSYSNYECEIELTRIPTIEEIDLLENMTRSLIESYVNIEYFMQNRPAAHPVTMRRLHCPCILSNNFSVTLKADGERSFLMITESFATYINPITRKHIHQERNTSDIRYCLLDGEYVNGTYYVFDILFYWRNGLLEDWRNQIFLERLQLMRTVVQILNHSHIKLKKYYNLSGGEDILRQAFELWKGYKVPYSVDGLIFVPHNPQFSIFKWKPEITIDVCVQYDHEMDFTFFKARGSKNTNIIWTTGKSLLVDKLRKANMGVIVANIFKLGRKGKPAHPSTMINSNDVLEYTYCTRTRRWLFKTLRKMNKKIPNSYQTIQGNLESMLDPICLSDFMTDEFDAYDFFGNSHDKRKTWRVYNNYVKRKLLHQLEGSQWHLDIACGKISDMHKYLQLKFQNILAIDQSKETIACAEQRLVRMKWCKRKHFYEHSSGCRIWLVCANMLKDIRSTEAANSLADAQILNSFFNHVPKQWQGFDSASCMFAIHYAFGQKIENNQWEKTHLSQVFADNLATLLRPGGIFTGIFLDSAQIYCDRRFVDPMDGKLLYEVRIQDNQENTVKSVEVTNESWSLCTMSEPLIGIQDIFKLLCLNNKFAPMSYHTAAQWQFEFQNEHKCEMDNIQKQLCQLNSWFSYERL